MDRSYVLRCTSRPTVRAMAQHATATSRAIFQPVARPDDLVSVALQRHRHRLADHFVVLDEEDRDGGGRTGTSV
jgi:hypothetical protein